mgnify:CR=1 FL=1
MNRQKKAIGLIGGMGPDAYARLYGLIVDMARKNFGAVKNSDYPEIILFSVPVPDFIENKKNMNKALVMLNQKLKTLGQLDLCSLGIACNTAHILIPKMKRYLGRNFISMIEKTVKDIEKKKYRKVGILGSPITIKSRLYQTELNRKGIEFVLPNNKDTSRLGRIILDVVSGKQNKVTARNLLEIAGRLKKAGAEAIILGCTELPLIFPKHYVLPIIDTNVILAEALLKSYYAEAKFDVE